MLVSANVGYTEISCSVNQSKLVRRGSVVNNLWDIVIVCGSYLRWLSVVYEFRLLLICCASVGKFFVLFGRKTETSFFRILWLIDLHSMI